MTTISESTQAATSGTLADNLYRFAPYNSEVGASQIEGTHLIVCQYRAVKGKKAKHENAKVYVPAFIGPEWIAENIDALQEYFEGYLSDKLADMVKASYEAGTTKLGATECNGDALLAYLEATASTSRLSGEDVKKWFADYVQGPLAAAIAAKFDFPESVKDWTDAQTSKLGKLLVVYQSKFVSLAGRSSLNRTEAESLLRALEIAEDSDSGGTGIIGRRFKLRLEKIASTEEELLDNL